MKPFTLATRIALALALVGAMSAVLGTGIVVFASQDRDDDDSRTITGVALVRATAAALQFTGGGRVTETEVGDEEGYYEVEVTMEDGRQIDVHLNEKFEVIGNEVESPEGEDDKDDDEDDEKPNAN